MFAFFKNLKFRSAVVLAAILIFPVVLTAQTGSISGVVVDEKSNQPLPGANIFIKGTSMGAASDADGKYKITNVPPGNYNLLAAYIGYYTLEQTVQVVVNEVAVVNFNMRVSILKADEIVVTGTGYDLKKRELTTAISTISTQEIEMAPVISIEQVLQGRVVGGVVNVNTGQPGTAGRIRLRGVTSATVSQTPVIYVDGVRVDNNDNFRLENFTGGPNSNALSDILADNIERIEITKGGAASTLYGSEAANGVIQIFTKKGKAGPTRWTFSTEQGVNQPEKKFIIEDFTKEHLLDSGYYQKYAFSADGGNENVTYHVSGHVMDSEGVVPKNGDTQYSFRMGVRAFASEKLQLDVSGGLIRDDFERLFSDNAIASVMTTIEGGDPPFGDPNATLDEKLAALEEYLLPQLDEAVNRFNFGITASANPNQFISTRLTLGADYRKNEQRYFIPIAAQGIASRPGGGIDRFDREFLSITLDYAATLKYPTSGAITSAFTAGAQGFREEDRTSRVTATQFGLPGTDDFDNAANLTPQESNFEIFSGGFFFNEQIGIRDRLFLTAGIRFDGNTAFGDEVNLESYPKVGAAYNISDEAFWKNIPFVGNFMPSLKLRASWGKTGSFPDPFTRDKQFTQGSFLGTVAANFGNPGDPTLGPEKTRTIEYGFDAAFLSERVGLEFTVFDEKTEDALFSVPSDPSTGLGFQLRNVGTIENNGIELGLTANIIDSRNFRFSLRGSYSTLDNEVTSLGGSQPFSIGGFAFLPLRIEEGHPVGVFRTNVPIPDPTTGQFDGDFLPNQFLHSPIADKYYSVGLNFTIMQNLNLSILGDGQHGGQILNTGSVIRFFNGLEPQASKVPPGYNFTTASDVFIEDANYFKIREITATYRLPRRYFGNQLTFGFSIRNALIFAGNDDLDPELNGVRSARDVDVGGINFFTLSPPRQFRFTLSINR
jgi:TonB-dependent SusC/RagA subfamily outer membrane receptor